MLAEADRERLASAWRPARAAGVLGDASIDEFWEHTVGFASAVCSAFSADCSTWNGHVLDAGTGAGVPGVLLARQLPHAAFTLVDALERRLDHTRAACRALDLSERVEVLHGRVDDLAALVSHRARYDAVVARLLTDPMEAAELLMPLVRAGGVVVASARLEEVDRWRAAACAVLPSATTIAAERPVGCFVSVQVPEPVATRFPRRASARRRRPLI